MIGNLATYRRHPFTGDKEYECHSANNSQQNNKPGKETYGKQATFLLRRSLLSLLLKTLLSKVILKETRSLVILKHQGHSERNKVILKEKGHSERNKVILKETRSF